MSAEQLLSNLRALDIRVSVEGDRLRCNAPSGRLTRELEQSITAHKAELIRMLRAGPQATATIPRRSAAAGQALPLSFAQERFWFLQNLDPESAAYNITAVRRLHRSIEASALREALGGLLRRHAILRTKFIEREGGLTQIVQDDWHAEIETHDLASMEAEGQAARVESIARELGARKFDLTNGRPIRVAWIQLGREDHCIVLCAHHIVCDGWSIGIFFTELSALYAAAVQGVAAALAEPSVQYGDYALWEREQQESPARRTQLDYWRRKIQGAPSALRLPLDRPRTDAAYQPALHRFQLDAATSESLKNLARESLATPFMVLLAVFKALLARYTSQNDIVVGTPVSTRTTSELEGLIGCFINTHLLRTEVPPSITARELISRVRTTVIESLTHADVPFEVLARELTTERDVSRSPLFQVACILLNTPKAQEYTVVSGGSTLDMTLYLWERDGRFEGSVEYDSALFDQQTIACLGGCYQTLAGQLASQPDLPLDQMAMVTAPQEREWFGQYNGAETTIPAGCVDEWVQRQVGATPDRTAVVCGTERLSFRELWARSGKLAGELRRLGIKRGSVVGLCLDRNLNLAVAPLGVWRAGGAYLPLDPDYPANRLSFMLKDSGAEVLITESHLVGRLPEEIPPVICLDQDDEREAQEEGLGAHQGTADDLAYVIYTSGSTGRPKGVEIRHRSLMNFLASMQREPGMQPADRLLAVTTPSFDIAGLEMWLPLVSGAQVVIAPRDAIADGGELARLLTEFEITTMQATPSTWRILLESGWKCKPGLKILCGGEALTADAAGRLLDAGAELWNLYGPTETTIWSTLQRIAGRGQRISIGHPIANTQVCVLDEQGRPLPSGLTGELYIGGAGLARGYRGLEELTAARFVTGKGSHSGERLYRTGDLVRRLPGGTLEYVGRADGQVKVRGVRIECGEIEAALERHPGVAQAVVAAHDDNAGDKRLVAFWTARDGPLPGAAELRKSLRSFLPESMIPAEFVRLDAFPLTANRKVDRKALLDADYLAKSRGMEFTDAGKNGERKNDQNPIFPDAPGNHVELVLAKIWCEVLSVPRVGVHDNFFDLGGHSFLATRLVSRIRGELRIELPLRAIFADPTIAGLAGHILFEPSSRSYSYTKEVTPWKRLVPVQPRGGRTPLFFVAGHQNPDDPLLFFSSLIPHFGADQPVFGFRPRWMEEFEDHYASVEEMARDYLAEIRQVQPVGPYLLGGNCVDGIAALEIARLLQQEGEEVRLVVLLDTQRPTPQRALKEELFFWRRRLGNMAEVLAAVAQAKGDQQREAIGALAARKLGIAQSEEARAADRFYRRKLHYQRLLYRHIPQPLSTRILLIANQEALQLDGDFGWTGFSSCGIEIHSVSGNHESMVAEQAVKIAHIIRRSIDEALPESEETMRRSELEVL